MLYIHIFFKKKKKTNIQKEVAFCGSVI